MVSEKTGCSSGFGVNNRLFFQYCAFALCFEKLNS